MQSGGVCQTMMLDIEGWGVIELAKSSTRTSHMHPHYETCPPKPITRNISHISFSTTHPSLHTQPHLSSAHTILLHPTSPTTYTPQEQQVVLLAPKPRVSIVIVSHKYVVLQVLNVMPLAIWPRGALRAHALSQWGHSTGLNHRVQPLHHLYFPYSGDRLEPNSARPELDEQALAPSVSRCSSAEPAAYLRSLMGSQPFDSTRGFVKNSRAATLTPSQTKWLRPTLTISDALGVATICVCTSDAGSQENAARPGHASRAVAPVPLPSLPVVGERGGESETETPVSGHIHVSVDCTPTKQSVHVLDIITLNSTLVALSLGHEMHLVTSPFTMPPLEPSTITRGAIPLLICRRLMEPLYHLFDNLPPAALRVNLIYHKPPSPMFSSCLCFGRALGGPAVLPVMHLESRFAQAQLLRSTIGRSDDSFPPGYAFSFITSFGFTPMSVVQAYSSPPIKNEAVSLYVACTHSFYLSLSVCMILPSAQKCGPLGLHKREREKNASTGQRESENDGWQGRLKGLGVRFPPGPIVYGSCHSWPSTSGGLEAGPSPQHVFRINIHCMSNDRLGLQKVTFASCHHLSSRTSYRPLVYGSAHAHPSLPLFLSLCTARSSHQDSPQAGPGQFFPSSHESTVNIESEREKAKREYSAWPATAADLETGKRRVTPLASTSGHHRSESTERMPHDPSSGTGFVQLQDAPLDFGPQATAAPQSAASMASQRMMLPSAGFEARSPFDASIGDLPVQYVYQVGVTDSLGHISARHIAAHVMHVESESPKAAKLCQCTEASTGMRVFSLQNVHVPAFTPASSLGGCILSDGRAIVPRACLCNMCARWFSMCWRTLAQLFSPGLAPSQFTTLTTLSNGRAMRILLPLPDEWACVSVNKPVRALWSAEGFRERSEVIPSSLMGLLFNSSNRSRNFELFLKLVGLSRSSCCHGSAADSLRASTGFYLYLHAIGFPC
jgi:hypothetical protein